jgi:hypothetical protein
MKDEEREMTRMRNLSAGEIAINVHNDSELLFIPQANLRFLDKITVVYSIEWTRMFG